MHRFKSCRAEGTDEAYTGNDHCPLQNEKDFAAFVAPVNQEHRSEGTADQQVDGRIVEAPPDFLDLRTAFKGMIEAAHCKKKDQAYAVKEAGHHFQSGIRF